MIVGWTQALADLLDHFDLAKKISQCSKNMQYNYKGIYSQDSGRRIASFLGSLFNNFIYAKQEWGL